MSLGAVSKSGYKELVLKTSEVKASVGSNPTRSAIPVELPGSRGRL